MSNTSQRVGFETERSVAAPFSGVSQNVGSALTNNPVIAIFDNQSTVEAGLYANGILFKTFSAGETFVLDLRANHGIAANYTIDENTQFSIIATGGTGFFRICILYAR